MLSAEELVEYRRERLARLERENEHLRADCVRLERLLGVALTVAVGGTGVSPWALLEVIAALAGTDPARSAWAEARERRDSERAIADLVRVLRETDPAVAA